MSASLAMLRASRPRRAVKPKRDPPLVRILRREISRRDEEIVRLNSICDSHREEIERERRIKENATGSWVALHQRLSATERYCQRIEAELRKTGWKPEDPVQE